MNDFEKMYGDGFSPTKDGERAFLKTPGDYLVRIIGWHRDDKSQRDDQLCLIIEAETIIDYARHGREDAQEGLIIWERFFLNAKEATRNRIAKLFQKARVFDDGAIVTRMNDTGMIARDFDFNPQYLNRLLGSILVFQFGMRDYQGEPRLDLGYNMALCADEDWRTHWHKVNPKGAVPDDGLPDAPPPTDEDNPF